jgi:hypothetical protein
MGKQFDDGDTVQVSNHYYGTVLGEDRENAGLYRVRLIDGPQRGKVFSYAWTILSRVKTR